MGRGEEAPPSPAPAPATPALLPGPSCRSGPTSHTGSQLRSWPRPLASGIQLPAPTPAPLPAEAPAAAPAPLPTVAPREAWTRKRGGMDKNVWGPLLEAEDVSHCLSEQEDGEALLVIPQFRLSFKMGHTFLFLSKSWAPFGGVLRPFVFSLHLGFGFS